MQFFFIAVITYWYILSEWISLVKETVTIVSESTPDRTCYMPARQIDILGVLLK